MNAKRRTARLAGIALFAALVSGGGLAHAQDTDACINASEKALAMNNAGKLIDARASLATCAASSCPDAVRSSCQQRLGEVNQAIPSIVFFAKDGSGHDLAGVSVAIDGKMFADHLGGNPIVLDPGEHEFRFESAGRAPVTRRLVLHQGEQNRREEIVIGAAPAAPPAMSGPAPASTPPPVTNQAATSDGSSQRTIGLVVGGVGLAGLIAGGIFGALSMSAHSSYMQSCGSNVGLPAGQCNQTGVNGQSDAAMKGTLSTVFFIGGGVLTAAGAVVFFTAPSAPSTQVGVGPGSLLVTGQF